MKSVLSKPLGYMYQVAPTSRVALSLSAALKPAIRSNSMFAPPKVPQPARFEPQVPMYKPLSCAMVMPAWTARFSSVCDTPRKR